MVTPVLRNIRVQRRVSTVLEAEGVLIDPIGVLIAVLALEVVVAPAASSVTGAVTWLALRIGFGALAGAVFGLFLALLLRTPRVIPEGYENIVTLGGVLLLFAGCEFVLSESGILAATISGIMVGNFQTRIGGKLRRFEEQIIASYREAVSDAGGTEPPPLRELGEGSRGSGDDDRGES